MAGRVHRCPKSGKHPGSNVLTAARLNLGVQYRLSRLRTVGHGLVFKIGSEMFDEASDEMLDVAAPSAAC
jgi:hypothetical protein